MCVCTPIETRNEFKQTSLVGKPSAADAAAPPHTVLLYRLFIYIVPLLHNIIVNDRGARP